MRIIKALSTVALVVPALAMFPATPATAPAPAPEFKAIEWANDTLDFYGIELPANTSIKFTDKDNCGSQVSPSKTGGGCMVTLPNGDQVVMVSPSAITAGTAEHILLHESAHALGIMDECKAELFSTDRTAHDIYSYPECAPTK